jgi:hypothetical protein
MTPIKKKKNNRAGDGLFIAESENAPLHRRYRSNYFQNGSLSDPRFVDPRITALEESATILEDRLPFPNVEQSEYVRHMMGSFWTYSEDYNERTINVYRNRFPDSPLIRGVEQISSFQRQDGTVSEEIRLEFLDPSARQRVLTDLGEFLSSYSGSFFYDHATTFNIFEDGSNEKEQQLGILNLYAEVKSDYNFLQKKYEEGLAEKNEITLPNFYNFMLFSQGETPSENAIILTQGGRIQIPNQTPILGTNDFERSLGGPKSSFATPSSAEIYLNVFTDTYEEWQEQERTLDIGSKMANIVFTQQEVKKLDELFIYKEMFPMFNTVEFTTENDSRLGSVLEDTNFSSELRNYLGSAEARRNSTSIITGEARFNRRENTREVDIDNVTGERRYYDIDDFFDNYQRRIGEETFENIYFNTSSGMNPVEHTAFFNLMSIIAKGKIERIKKEVTRTYEEVVKGVQAHSEVVFYKVDKFDEENNYIQSFHFTNTTEVDIIKFVDTQVKYDKSYTYKISSVNIVFGTRYKYLSSLYDIESLSGTIRVMSEPSIKMVEVPLFEKKVLIKDNLPIAPEASMIPFRGINNRIRFWLSSGYGRYMAQPIIFTEEDVDMVNQQRVAQDIPMTQKEIMFETDDEIVEFHLYKMEQEPFSYQDFVSIGEKIEIKTANASAASYDDKIQPNKEYYYCVRSVDYHGNVSYPSVVYKAEMIDDAGSIYPSFSVHEFRENVGKYPSMGVKRFISISPSAKNVFVNERSMNILDGEGPEENQQVVLGVEDASTWNKKFKIRLTSKETGRKVDFNFTFKQKDENR